MQTLRTIKEKFVLSTTAEMNMDHYGISEDEIEEVMSTGKVRPVGGIFAASAHTRTDRYLGVAYKPWENDKVLICMVYRTRDL